MFSLNRKKRERILFITLFTWIYFLVLSYFYQCNYSDLSIYFISLTGFVGSYIWGESVRSSVKTKKEKVLATKSKREKVLFAIIFLWIFIGTISIIKEISLNSMSMYFGSLTPFISAYILGETYKPTKINSIEESQEI